MATRPSVLVLGGPNGSGKSTAAVRLLKETLKIVEFVNADEIAKGLSPFNPEGVAIQAGRIMLNRLDELAKRGESFAFESTLASRSFATWIEQLQRDQNYEFRLVYIWLRDPLVNVERVRMRVMSGGHGIPESTIHRRYFRSVRNLFELYIPLANSWEIFDNSDAAEFRLIASGRAKKPAVVIDSEAWGLLRAQHDGAGNE